MTTTQITNAVWLAMLLILNLSQTGCDSPNVSESSGDGENRTRSVPTINSTATDQTSVGYAGSRTCARCHSSIAKQFAQHPMSRSVLPVKASAGIWHEEATLPGRSRVLQVKTRSDVLLHGEVMQDVRGNEIYEQMFEMDFVVGSGRRAFAFLHQEADLLFQSPLNWYSSSGQWDLAPGYVEDDPRRFRRRVTDSCLACHAGRVASLGESQNRYAAAPFQEMSIGCENCHGPAEGHVRFREAENSQGADPIINPVKLNPRARESVCNQCHLQGTRILRSGRGHFDFRPGDDLTDIWAVFEAEMEESADGELRAVGHVQQMRASRCFVASAGRMGCISCHSPHSVPAETHVASYYRQKCQVCHEQQPCAQTETRRMAVDNSCIACHMGRRQSKNISHVAQTDHRILRTPSQSTVPVNDSPNTIRLKFFDDADKRMEEWSVRRATAGGLWLELEKRGLSAPAQFPDLLTATLKNKPADVVSLTLLGSFYRQKRDFARSIEYFEVARRQPDGEETALNALLSIYYLQSEWPKALDCADRIIEIDPQEARYHALRADILKQTGRLQEAIAEGHRSLELDPTVIPVREWLVSALSESDASDELTRQTQILAAMKARIEEAKRQSSSKRSLQP